MDTFIQSTIDNTINQALKAKADDSRRDLVNVNPRGIDEAAREFEAVFLAQMIKPMFDTVPDNPVLGGGPGKAVCHLRVLAAL